jgi:hypothetical protein
MAALRITQETASLIAIERTLSTGEALLRE